MLGTMYPPNWLFFSKEIKESFSSRKIVDSAYMQKWINNQGADIFVTVLDLLK